MQVKSCKVWPQSPNSESNKKVYGGVRPPYQMGSNPRLAEDDFEGSVDPRVPVRMFLWRAVEIKYHKFILTVCEAQEIT